MRVIVAEAEHRLAEREREDPRPGPLALVRIDRVGLCGTDLKILGGEIPAEFPRVLGHEMIGRVVAPGARGSVPEGTRVVVDPSISCGHCHVCHHDRPHLCPNGALMGRDVDGGLAELVAVDEARLQPIPDTVPGGAEPLLQVLTTCIHAHECVGAFPGQTAVVIGLGVSGLLHLQLLRARGVETVIGVTRSSAKRDLAVSLGASAVATPDQAEQRVAELTSGRGADVSVECVGKPETLRQSMHLAGLGATVLAFGTTSPYADGMPTYEWYRKELQIVNPRAARPRDFERAITLATGGLQLAPLVTDVYPMSEAAAAFEACRDPAQLKVVLGWNT